MPSNPNENEWPWICREDSTKIDRRIGCKRIEVVQHPLELSTSANSVWSGKKDPLSRNVASEPLVLMLDGDDPLSAFHKRQMEPSNTEDDDSDNVVASKPVTAFMGLEPWTAKKAKILSQCNTHELSSNMSCFALQDRDLSLLAIKSGHRDDFEEGITFDNDVSAQEFCKRLDSFHADMVQSWNEDQRVKALKIAIQCSKLLSDTLPHSYYPNRYIHVTDILDTFGNLVYDRLKQKCRQFWKPSQIKKQFPEQFASDIVPDEVKETCLNWFYKIASIRELIPRLYVEATLLQSYSFIKTRENGKILRRLTETARGIGDPLVNLYSRCYLCRVGVLNKVTDFKFFSVNLDEFMAIYDTIFLRLPKIRLNYPKYIMAFVPPFEWIVQGVLADDDNMQQVLFERFRDRQNNTLLLFVILTSFPHSFVINHATEVREWLEDCNFEHIPIFKFLSQLANCYSEQRKNFGTSVPDPIMNAVWDFIFRIDTATHYLTCLEKWLPLSNDSLPPDRIDGLFQKTMNLIHKDRSDEKNVFKQLRDVVLNLTQCADDFLPLLTANNFLPFLNLFRDDQTKIPVCKSILDAFVHREEDKIIGNTIILNNLMVVAKAIHDSMSALTVVDERRQIGNLLSKFVLKIQFGRDFEQQLDFYVEARGAFFNSDIVHYTLVHRVNKLAFDTLIVVKGHHKSRTSTFVRACAAFCFITIPSLSSPLQRLQLYMLSGQVALANQCLGQADSFFCEAINTILQFTEIIESASANVKGEPILISYIKELLSILLVVPDNPEENVMLGLIRKLVDSISQFRWEDGDTTICSLYIQVLHLLSAAYQDDYPYHAQNVDSNDTLYASDPQFKQEIDRLCSAYLAKILNILQELGVDGKSNKQGMLAYELFFCILSRADVSIREMTKLAVNVWNLARRNGTFDKRVAVQTLEYCIRSSPKESIYAEIFEKLLAKLE